MKTIQEQVRQLSPEELAELRGWLDRFAPQPPLQGLPLSELPEVLASLPRLGAEEAEAMARDLEEVRAELAGQAERSRRDRVEGLKALRGRLEIEGDLEDLRRLEVEEAGER